MADFTALEYVEKCNITTQPLYPQAHSNTYDGQEIQAYIKDIHFADMFNRIQMREP